MQPEPEHSWDASIDRMRAEEEAADLRKAHQIAHAAAVRRHRRWLAIAALRSKGRIDPANLTRAERSRLLTLMGLDGPYAGIDNYLKEKDELQEARRQQLRWHQEYIALQERNNRKIEEIRQQIAQEKKEDTP